MVKRLLAQSYIALILLLLYLPIFLLITFSFIDTRVVGVIGPNATFTFDLYRRLFINEKAMSALGNTFLVAFVSSTLATFLGTVGAIGIFYMRRTGKRLFETLTQIPVINAEIVMALSLAVLFIFFGYFEPDFLTLVIGHIVLTVAFVYLSVKPKLQQMDPSIYEAALDLGATPLKALWLVIIPQIFPGILAGFVLAFTLSLDDFIITSFLKPTSGFDTLSTYVEAQLRVGIPPEIRALTTIIFLFAVGVLIVNYALTGKGDRKQISGITHR
jgi:spermidine/putrescine transport system permease protein